MGEVYASLEKDWTFRGWSNAPYTLVNGISGATLSLREAAGYVAKSCDGLCDFSSPAYLPQHRVILKKFCELGIARLCEKGCRLTPIQKYKYADNPMLLEIHWAVTGFCNMNCGHCFMQSPSGKYGEPSKEEIEIFLSQFEKANVVSVSLTGGEPLLRKDFPWLVNRLTEKGFYINEIVTNGLLLDDKLLRLLESCGQHPYFQISFDGIGIHDQMRGTRDCEDRVLNAIRRTVDAGYFTSVSTTFSRENIHTAADTYEALKRIDVPLWLVGRAQTAGNWKGRKNVLTIDELARTCLEIQKRWLVDGRPMRIAMEQFYQAQLLGYQTKMKVNYTPESLECPETTRRLFLLPDGTLLPCTGFTDTTLEKKMPNLKEQELSEILKNEGFQNFLHETKRARWVKLSECRTCRYFPECGSGCRAYAMSETGSMANADPVKCEAFRSGWRQRFQQAEQEFETERIYYGND